MDDMTVRELVLSLMWFAAFGAALRWKFEKDRTDGLFDWSGDGLGATILVGFMGSVAAMVCIAPFVLAYALAVN